MIFEKQQQNNNVPSDGQRTSPVVSNPSTPATHGDIAQRAYDIYVESGYLEGRCEQNWQQAAKDLQTQGPVACQEEHRRKEFFAPDSVENA